MHWFWGAGFNGDCTLLICFVLELCIWRCSVNSFLSLYPCIVNSLILHDSEDTISSFNHISATFRIVSDFQAWVECVESMTWSFILSRPISNCCHLQTHPKVKIMFEFLSHADCVFIYLVRKNTESEMHLKTSNTVKLKCHLH